MRCFVSAWGAGRSHGGSNIYGTPGTRESNRRVVVRGRPNVASLDERSGSLRRYSYRVSRTARRYVPTQIRLMLAAVLPDMSRGVDDACEPFSVSFVQGTFKRAFVSEVE